MSENENHDEHVESFPGGITETDKTVPFFLKLTYVFFCLFGVTYWALYSAGDAQDPLVKQLNQATQAKVSAGVVP